MFFLSFSRKFGFFKLYYWNQTVKKILKIKSEGGQHQIQKFGAAFLCDFPKSWVLFCSKTQNLDMSFEKARICAHNLTWLYSDMKSDMPLATLCWTTSLLKDPPISRQGAESMGTAWVAGWLEVETSSAGLGWQSQCGPTWFWLHPGELTWNLKKAPSKRKRI